MKNTFTNLLLAALTLIFGLATGHANPLTITVSTPQPPQSAGFKMGQSRRPDGVTLSHDAHALIRGIKPATAVALEVSGSNGGQVQIVLLAEPDSLALWKASWQGREHAFFTKAGLVVDGKYLQLTATNREDLSVGVYPAPTHVSSGGNQLAGKSDGVFKRFTPRAPAAVTIKPAFEQLQPAGPPRDIPLGKIKQPVAAAPEDPDFGKAAVWRIKLPAGVDLGVDRLLRLDYLGDVARVLLNGKLVTDDFYNGKPFEIGLRRHAPEILNGDLRVAILPLRKDAPIYMAKEARPPFGDGQSVVALRSVELVPRYQVQLTAQY